MNKCLNKDACLLNEVEDMEECAKSCVLFDDRFIKKRIEAILEGDCNAKTCFEETFPRR